MCACACVRVHACVLACVHACKYFIAIYFDVQLGPCKIHYWILIQGVGGRYGGGQTFKFMGGGVDKKINICAKPLNFF